MTKRNTGFTLIEVVIAVAIFGIAVTIFSQSLYNGLLSIEASRKKDPIEEDLLLVRRHVLDIKEKTEIENGGDLETYHSGNVRWDVELDDTNTADLIKAKLKMDFRDKQPRTEVAETLYLYRKKWMDDSKRNAIIENKKGQSEKKQND